MPPMQRIDSQSYEEIRDQLLAKLKSQCPSWPIDRASDPARVFVELFSWLSEQSQFRLGQRSDDDIRRLYQSFGFHARPPQGAKALCQFYLDEKDRGSTVIVPAGTKLSAKEHGEDIIFQTTDELSLHDSELSHALSVKKRVATRHDISSPWQPFLSADPTGFDLYFQDALLESLLGDGEVTIPFADGNAAKRASDWRWELWHDEKWKGLSVIAGDENLTLDYDRQLQLLPSPGNAGFPPEVLKQLQANQWTIRAQVPGRDRSLIAEDFHPQIWARQSQRDFSPGQQDDGDCSYSWTVPNIPENASLSARIGALDLGEHPDLLASLEWVGSKQSMLIASLAEDTWTIEDASSCQFSARHDVGEWHFYWQVPEDWDHEDEATLQLTLSYDYAPDGGAFVEVLAAHAEPLPDRLLASVDTLSAVEKFQSVLVFDESQLSEQSQDRDGLYLGFDSWNTAQSASFYFEMAQAHTQPGPTIRWECWSGEDWKEVEVDDHSDALTNSGLVTFGPCSSVAKELQGHKCHWFRGTVISGSWLLSPTIKNISPNVVWAVEGRRIDRELVGQGDGVASLSLKLKEDAVSAMLSVVSTNSQGEESPWEPVSDFLESGPTDCHFVFDGSASELLFGDGLKGKIPEAGSQLFASYKVSAGLSGQLAPQRLQVVDPQRSLRFHGTNIEGAFGATERE
ncbi:MAG: hypothetical protein P1V97_29030, partial [Planctomycetota bacterium]|nr:hypothetical protein [Planctomycetota bacterium]